MNEILYFLKQIHAYSGKSLYFNLFGMMVMSLLEGVGILLLIPMISMSGILNLDAGGSSISNVFQFLNDIPGSIGMPIILGVFVLVVIIQNLIQRHMSIRNAIIQQGFLRHIRVNIYNSLLHSNWNFFIKNKKSDLINLLKKEITRASSGTNSLLQFITSIVFTLIQIGLAFLLSPNLTLLVLVLFILIVNFLNNRWNWETGILNLVKVILQV